MVEGKIIVDTEYGRYILDYNLFNLKLREIYERATEPSGSIIGFGDQDRFYLKILYNNLRTRSLVGQIGQENKEHIVGTSVEDLFVEFKRDSPIIQH